MSAPAKTAEEVQAEMEAYSPVTGPAMSPELRARFVAETNPERITDGMGDAALWTAWLRS
jgi:hypothetical protein